MCALRLSFETFPAKNELEQGKYLDMLSQFQSYRPMFQSMTYGAGASDRNRSEDLIPKAISRIGAKGFVPHLVSAGQTKTGIKALATNWAKLGVEHIVALRGDASAEGEEIFCAAELVELLKSVADFDISVAGYPEKHPLSASVSAELTHLKRKVDAGANRVLTQFFFDADIFLRYRDLCQAKGIEADIIPGILPIGSIAQVSRFAGQCGATLPRAIVERFKGLENQPDAHTAVAVATVLELIDRLNREGVDDFHLYTLNKLPMTLAICHSLGIYPEQKIAA